jgi:hypothetical protein
MMGTPLPSFGAPNASPFLHMLLERRRNDNIWREYRCSTLLSHDVKIIIRRQNISPVI